MRTSHKTPVKWSMCLCVKKIFAHVLPVEARVFELSKNRAAAAAVNKKIFVAVAYHEAGVVAFGDKRVARAEHCEFHEMSP